MSTEEICGICGNEAENGTDNTYGISFFMSDCLVCGRYRFNLSDTELDAKARNEIAPYLFYNNEGFKTTLGPIVKKPVFITTEKNCEKVKSRVPENSKVVAIEEINNWYPRTDEDKINKILLGLSNRPEYNDGRIALSAEQLYSAFFVKRYNEKNKYGSEKQPVEELESQVEAVYNLLRKNSYIEIWGSSIAEKMSADRRDISITAEGKKRMKPLSASR